MAKQMTLLLSIHRGLQESIVKVGVITFPHMHSTQSDQSTDLCAEWVCKAGKNDLEKGFKWCEGWGAPGFQSSLSAKDTAEKGKQPLFNEPLKECPLYLGFIIFIVNPSQPSSASHSHGASAAKFGIIY